MSDITITYKNNSIATLDDSGSTTLKTGGTYCEDDITVTYVAPSGSSEPEDVATLSFGSEAFRGASGSKITGLKALSGYNDVTSIGDKCFYYCTALESISGFNSATSIGDSGFYYCSSLKSVTGFNSVKSIGNNAFYYCSSLESITGFNSIASIGSAAFKGCSSLENISFGGSMSFGTSSSYGPLNGVTHLQTATLPGGSYGNYAFYTDTSTYYTYLTTVTLGGVGRPVTSITSKAFKYCTGSFTLNIYTTNGAALSNQPWGATNATVVYHTA